MIDYNLTEADRIAVDLAREQDAHRITKHKLVAAEHHCANYSAQLRSAYRRENELFELLVRVGKQGGEYHEACSGTGRTIVCVDDNLSAADLREMKEMDPAAFDESFPDDCDDPNCFQGWFVDGGE